MRVSVVGVTGYTGLELTRLLRAHPDVEIVHLTSRQNIGIAVDALFPHLSPLLLPITNPSYADLARDSDVVFLALPHKTAQEAVAALYGKTKVIDLSADYRFQDTATYEKYYCSHAHPELLGKVVYGAPEIVGVEVIQNATAVANPGCYALLVQLLLAPFKGAIAHADVIAITGSSGGGREASEGTHHPIRSHNMKSYSINVHRHIPEITRGSGIIQEQLNLIPTSGPFVRGIFATAFITLTHEMPFPTYDHAPFVRVVNTVALANIVGSNYVDVSFTHGTSKRIIAQGALDNLVKGAAGSAIQNMNLMCGLPQTQGLDILTPLYP